MTTTAVSDPALEAELRGHAEALSAFLVSAEGVPAEEFDLPAASGKWSPAQIAEHLRLSYATVRAELAGTGGFRVRSRGWLLPLLRLRYLPRILERGLFPRGVPAVREIRPSDGPFEKAEVLDALRREGELFVHAIIAAWNQPRAAITHPFLGRLSVAKGLRFVTQHIRHHHAQMPRAAPVSDPAPTP